MCRLIDRTIFLTYQHECGLLIEMPAVQDLEDLEDSPPILLHRINM